MNPQPKPTTWRSDKYLKWIRQQPCIVTQLCSGKSEAHHEDILKSGGTACKGHDSTCLPLCRLHHAERHQMGRDTFFERWAIDPAFEIVRHLTRYMVERGIK